MLKQEKNIEFFLFLLIVGGAFCYFYFKNFYTLQLDHDPSMYLSQSIGFKACFNNSMGIDCYRTVFLDGNTKATFFPVFGGILSSIFNLHFLTMKAIILITSFLLLAGSTFKIIRNWFSYPLSFLICSFYLSVSGIYFPLNFYSRDTLWLTGIHICLFYILNKKKLNTKDNGIFFVSLVMAVLVRPILTFFIFAFPVIILFREFKKWNVFKKHIYGLSVIYLFYITPFLYDLVDYIYVSVFLEEAKQTLGVFDGRYGLKFFILSFRYYFLFVFFFVGLKLYKKKNKSLQITGGYFLFLIGYYTVVLPYTDLVRFVSPVFMLLYLYLFYEYRKAISEKGIIKWSFVCAVAFNLYINSTIPLPQRTMESQLSEKLILRLEKLVSLKEPKILIVDNDGLFEYRWQLELYSFNNNKLWSFDYLTNSEDESKELCKNYDYILFTNEKREDELIKHLTINERRFGWYRCLEIK